MRHVLEKLVFSLSRSLHLGLIVFRKRLLGGFLLATTCRASEFRQQEQAPPPFPGELPVPALVPVRLGAAGAATYCGTSVSALLPVSGWARRARSPAAELPGQRAVGTLLSDGLPVHRGVFAGALFFATGGVVRRISISGLTSTAAEGAAFWVCCRLVSAAESMAGRVRCKPFLLLCKGDRRRCRYSTRINPTRNYGRRRLGHSRPLGSGLPDNAFALRYDSRRHPHEGSARCLRGGKSNCRSSGGTRLDEYLARHGGNPARSGPIDIDDPVRVVPFDDLYVDICHVGDVDSLHIGRTYRVRRDVDLARAQGEPADAFSPGRCPS